MASRSPGAGHGSRDGHGRRLPPRAAPGARRGRFVRRSPAESGMSLRVRVRRSLPYAIAIIGGFLLAYLVVAFFVFPSGVIPRDIKVPNVTGLPFDDAVR